ncbi:hypothetical protein CRENBAI_017404 [Crenichthys baileyi]|uniref:Uncharacterized protein n=1 Tax=Crenichthys baileyi TaxID=28760 RepID=A0AAV9RQX2_9TELE
MRPRSNQSNESAFPLQPITIQGSALMAAFPSSQLWASASPSSPCLHFGYCRHVVWLLQWFLLRSSYHTPGFDVFFYSSHPTIFPASFIHGSMDSHQRSISSFTQLLREFASNSATSALPLLRSADVQPAPRPLPLTFTLATPVLARL